MYPLKGDSSFVMINICRNLPFEPKDRTDFLGRLAVEVAMSLGNTLMEATPRHWDARSTPCWFTLLVAKKV